MKISYELDTLNKLIKLKNEFEEMKENINTDICDLIKLLEDTLKNKQKSKIDDIRKDTFRTLNPTPITRDIYGNILVIGVDSKGKVGFIPKDEVYYLESYKEISEFMTVKETTELYLILISCIGLYNKTY